MTTHRKIPQQCMPQSQQNNHNQKNQLYKIHSIRTQTIHTYSNTTDSFNLQYLQIYINYMIQIQKGIFWIFFFIHQNLRHTVIKRKKNRNKTQKTPKYQNYESGRPIQQSQNLHNTFWQKQFHNQNIQFFKNVHNIILLQYERSLSQADNNKNPTLNWTSNKAYHTNIQSQAIVQINISDIESQMQSNFVKLYNIQHTQSTYKCYNASTRHHQKIVYDIQSTQSSHTIQVNTFVELGTICQTWEQISNTS
eukprot:TRINITY_DN4384_c0_g1_i9.p1 TRINITY_DN4384_c0_g1~~TRINITY_DN4384_c0_g1_i9.p1  ORF type:complete len:250 (-),score=-21.73 TRINITY_DN4384_c0_g1_i9:306-1055(-)